MSYVKAEGLKYSNIVVIVEEVRCKRKFNACSTAVDVYEVKKYTEYFPPLNTILDCVERGGLTRTILSLRKLLNMQGRSLQNPNS